MATWGWVCHDWNESRVGVWDMKLAGCSVQRDKRVEIGTKTSSTCLD